MYGRNVRIMLRIGSAQEFRRLLQQRMIPLLRSQKGFQDEVALISPKRNEAVAINFWDNEENADAYNHVAYLDILRMLSKVVEGVPRVESFEVANSRLCENASSAAQSSPQ